jgi:hypothetical protein
MRGQCSYLGQMRHVELAAAWHLLERTQALERISVQLDEVIYT